MSKTVNQETYIKVRQLTVAALETALQKLLADPKPISELDLKKAWLKELRKNKSLFPSGWYIPPPNGIAILFATDKKPQRTFFRSLRFRQFYPKKNIFLDRENGILIAYASPVHKETGTIGDYGLTLYFGKSKIFISLIKEVIKIQQLVFQYAKVGMTFSQLYQYAEDLFKRSKVSNDWWVNVTDPSGRNMGHTIPGTEKDWTKDELEKLRKSKDWKEVVNLISKRRIFFSPAEKFKIKRGIVLTIEPRLRSEINATLPMAWFHTAAIFKQNDEKEFLTGFDDLFTLAHMNYML